jgi:hypothetical protein
VQLDGQHDAQAVATERRFVLGLAVKRIFLAALGIPVAAIVFVEQKLRGSATGDQKTRPAGLWRRKLLIRNRPCWVLTGSKLRTKALKKRRRRKPRHSSVACSIVAWQIDPDLSGKTWHHKVTDDEHATWAQRFRMVTKRPLDFAMGKTVEAGQVVPHRRIEDAVDASRRKQRIGNVTLLITEVCALVVGTGVLDGLRSDIHPDDAQPGKQAGQVKRP